MGLGHLARAPPRWPEVYGLTETYGHVVMCEPHEAWKQKSASEQAELMARQGVIFPQCDGARPASHRSRFCRDDELGENSGSDYPRPGSTVQRNLREASTQKVDVVFAETSSNFNIKLHESGITLH